MKVVEISDNLKVPFRWLIVFSAFLITVGPGVVIWLTTIYLDVAQAKTELHQIKDEDKIVHDRYLEMLQKIDRRLYRIELTMGTKPEQGEQ